MFVWLGDAAYLDMDREGMYIEDQTDDIVKERFKSTFDDPGYQRLVHSNTLITGVWDDHDYGANNAESSFKHKDRNRKHYLDFLEEPEDSQRRLQPKTGLYTSYILNDSTQLILLDNRYENDGSDRLGPTQWAWLDNLLSQPRRLTIICAGVQLLHNSIILDDVFGPQSLDKLYDLIAKHQVSNVLLLTGDVHNAQIIDNGCESLCGVKLVEVTSSGLSEEEAWWSTYFKFGVDKT